MKTVQLTSFRDEVTNRRLWDTKPLGRGAQPLVVTPHTTHTIVGNWKVDQQTGRAALVRQSVLDCL